MSVYQKSINPEDYKLPDYTMMFHLGTYRPQHIKDVEEGQIILAHCDGGYNELFGLSTAFPGVPGEGKYKIVSLTNGMVYCSDDPVELATWYSDMCWDWEKQDWVDVEEYKKKFEEDGYG